MKLQKNILIIFLTVGLSLSICSALAVNKIKIDSLKKALSICKIDTQKVNIQMELVNLYLVNNEVPDSAIIIGKRVIEYSTKIKYQLGISRGNKAMGLGYQVKENFDLAFKYLTVALNLDISLHKNDRVISDYISLAECAEASNEFEKGIEYYKAATLLCKAINNNKGLADIYKRTGINFFKRQNYLMALENLNKAMVLYKKLNDFENLEHVNNILANMYRVQNNYPKALEYQLKAMQIAEQINQAYALLSAYYLVADIYSDIQNYEKAIEYKLKALKLLEKNGDKKNIAACYFYIGKNYTEIEENYKSIFYINKALNVFKELSSQEGIGACYAILALAHSNLNEIEKAFEEIKLSISIFEELYKKNVRYKISMSGNYVILGNLYLKKKDYNKAVKYISESVKLDVEQTSYRHDLIKKYELLSSAYEGIGNYRLAFANLKKSKALHDSIFSDENNTKLSDLQRGFDLEKKEIELQAKAKVEEEKIKVKANLEIKQQQIQRNSLLGGFTLMMILAGVSYRNYRRKRNDNLIISEQKKLVEIKNKEITDSIAYALRIQTAILPPQKIVKQHLENSFILYKPKDIVAGDFYWMETVQLADEPISGLADEKTIQLADEPISGLADEKTVQLANEPISGLADEKTIQLADERISELANENKIKNNQLINSSPNQLILFAACDCTGHGVPGAMVSVVCHNALNRAVHEFGLIEPAAILDKTAEIVVENFAKSEEEIKDGMDISLCAYNPTTNQLEWAGANNPLWLIRNGEFIEIKADKQPIGMDEDHHPFTNHTFNLEKGDTIYIFSDGFADQFSPSDKKLMKKNFKNVLLSIQNKNMQQQHEYLNNFIENWKGNMEQTDDMLVIGVRV